MPSPSSRRRDACTSTRRRSEPPFSSSVVLLALLAISTTAFVLPSPPPSLLARHATPSHQHDPRPRPSLLPALRRLLHSTPSLLLVLPFITSAPLPALAAVAPAPQTTTKAAGAAAAANLPADVIATAVISLGKNANVDRLLLPSSSASTSTTTSSSDNTTPPPSSPPQEASPALYVTARVGSRGRVLASIKLPLDTLPSPAFPAVVQIREGDIYADTPEARHALAQQIQTADLVLSARLDRDGQASTRSPEDLVGQGTLYKFRSVDSAQWSRADIALTGRGAFGEFVTGGGGGKGK